MTPSEVVAKNIERIRTELGVSRKTVADRLGWTEHRVLDLEWGRGRHPSPTPDEVFALCTYLPITVFDIYLPPPGVETVALPFDSMKPPTGRDLVTASMDRGDYGQVLFGMPARTLEPDSLDHLFGSLAADNLERAILANHPEVVELLELLQEEQQHAFHEMMVAAVAAGVTRLEDADGNVMEPAEAMAAVEHRFGSVVPMSIDEARAEEMRVEHLIHETTDYAVDRLRRKIRQKRLPQPPVPDDPTAVWVEIAGGDDAPLDALVGEWLAKIEEIDTEETT